MTHLCVLVFAFQMFIITTALGVDGCVLVFILRHDGRNGSFITNRIGHQKCEGIYREDMNILMKYLLRMACLEVSVAGEEGKHFKT